MIFDIIYCMMQYERLFHLQYKKKFIEFFFVF